MYSDEEEEDASIGMDSPAASIRRVGEGGSANAGRANIDTHPGEEEEEEDFHWCW